MEVLVAREEKNLDRTDVSALADSVRRPRRSIRWRRVRCRSCRRPVQPQRHPMELQGQYVASTLSTCERHVGHQNKERERPHDESEGCAFQLRLRGGQEACVRGARGLDAGRTGRCRRTAARLARPVPLLPFARRRLIQGSAPEGPRAVGSLCTEAGTSGRTRFPSRIPGPPSSSPAQ